MFEPLGKPLRDQGVGFADRCPLRIQGVCDRESPPLREPTRAIPSAVIATCRLSASTLGTRMTANRRAGRSARRRGTTSSAERYLVGRVALVTGGASGQGLAIALSLAERGADIAIGSYIGRPRRPVAGADTYWPSDGELSDSCREIEKRGVRAVGAHLDVRSHGPVGAFMRHAQKGLGPIGILVNAAGTSAQQPICGHSGRLWTESLRQT